MAKSEDQDRKTAAAAKRGDGRTIKNKHCIFKELFPTEQFRQRFGNSASRYAGRPQINGCKFCPPFHLIGHCGAGLQCKLAASHVKRKLRSREKWDLRSYVVACKKDFEAANAVTNRDNSNPPGDNQRGASAQARRSPSPDEKGSAAVAASATNAAAAAAGANNRPQSVLPADFLEHFLQTKAGKAMSTQQQAQYRYLPAPVTPARSTTASAATQKKVDLDEVSFEQLEQAYVRRKRKNMLAFLHSAPFEMLEQVFRERKRLKSTVDLTSGNAGVQNPDGTGVALRIQAEQQQALVKVKVEKEEHAAQISKLQGTIEEEKKSAAATRTDLERVKECVVCQDADKCVVLHPCSHFALCDECQHVDECPICREKIKERTMIRVV